MTIWPDKKREREKKGKEKKNRETKIALAMRGTICFFRRLISGLLSGAPSAINHAMLATLGPCRTALFANQSGIKRFDVDSPPHRIIQIPFVSNIHRPPMRRNLFAVTDGRVTSNATVIFLHKQES